MRKSVLFPSPYIFHLPTLIPLPSSSSFILSSRLFVLQLMALQLQFVSNKTCSSISSGDLILWNQFFNLGISTTEMYALKNVYKLHT